MPFRNPIASNGGTLVRDCLQSENYAVDPDTGVVTGWQITREGAATFTDVAVGSATWGVDSAGDASFGSLAVAGSTTIYGRELQDLLDDLPRGCVAWARRATSGTAATTSTPYLELQATCQPGRLYELRASSFFMSMSANAKAVAQLLYTNDGSAVQTTSTIAASGRVVTGSTATAPTMPPLTFRFGIAPGASPLAFRFLIAYYGENSVTAYINSTSAYPVTLTLDDVGPYQDEIGIDRSSGNGSTTKTTYVKTYTASWTKCWRNGSTVYSTNGDCLQGTYGGNSHKSMIGFPSTLLTDLSGATITKLEAYLYYNHWYYGSGGTAYIGAHGQLNSPGSYSTVQAAITSTSWPNPGGRWVVLPSSWWAGFAAGTLRGLTLGEGAPSSGTYYGRANGAPAGSYPPQFRASYSK